MRSEEEKAEIFEEYATNVLENPDFETEDTEDFEGINWQIVEP